MTRRLAVVLLVAAALPGCGARTAPPTGPTPVATAPATSTVPSTPAEPTAVPAPTPSVVVVQPPGVRVAYRVQRRTDDPATADFAAVLDAVLTDPRGWARAGFRFVRDPDARFRIVLAEGAVVDRLCRPLETNATYSCQNGGTVALNADRWRSATPEWTGSLADYRTMLINHEVGHLLHLHHPDPQCPGRGLPAPVMAQQSTELGQCTANPWPLRWEVRLAAQRREPLAPSATHVTADHRPTPPRARR